MPGDSTSAIAQIGVLADAAYQDGRVIFTTHTDPSWYGDVDEHISRAVETVEPLGWRLELVSFDADNTPHLVFRRQDDWRTLR